MIIKIKSKEYFINDNLVLSFYSLYKKNIKYFFYITSKILKIGNLCVDEVVEDFFVYFCKYFLRGYLEEKSGKWKFMRWCYYYYLSSFFVKKKRDVYLSNINFSDMCGCYEFEDDNIDDRSFFVVDNIGKTEMNLIVFKKILEKKVRKENEGLSVYELVRYILKNKIFSKDELFNFWSVINV